MGTHRRARRPAETADIRVGRPDLGDQVDDDAGDVVVRRHSDGWVALEPRALQRASPAGQAVAARLQDAAAQIQHLNEQLQRDAITARGAGLSWDAIGWCLGLTGQAARKRYGDA